MDAALKDVLYVCSQILKLAHRNGTGYDEDKDIDEKYYIPYHESDTFVGLYKVNWYVPAIQTMIGLTTVMFMTKRKARWPNCLDGHFGLAVPTNFLESRKRRKPYVAAFALAAMYIIIALKSMDEEAKGLSASIKIFIKLFIMSFLGCYFLPLFACIFMGTFRACIFGLIYHAVILTLAVIGVIPAPNLTTKALVKELLLLSIVLIFAGTFLVYWFIKRIIRHWKIQSFDQEIPIDQVKYLKTLFLSKEKYLLLQEVGFLGDGNSGNKCLRWFRKNIYHKTPGFRYSLTILASCTIGFLIVTHISIMLFYDFIQNIVEILQLLDDFKIFKETTVPNFVRLFVKRFTRTNEEVKEAVAQKDADEISLYELLHYQSVIILVVTVVAGVAAYGLCIVNISRLLTSYRKNVLGQRKQKQNQFILNVSQKLTNNSLVRSAIQFGGYQVAYIVAGFSVQLFAFNLLLLILGEIIILPVQFAFWSFILKFAEIVGAFFLALLLIQLTQYLLIRFYFLEDKGATMALDNRRGFFIMSYFVFFYNILTGIFSCIRRIIVGAFIGLCLVPRLDASSYPRLYEHLDKGFKNYSCLLYLEALQSNPVAITFVMFLLRTKKAPSSGLLLEPKLNKRKHVALNRWFVAYTLIRNPSIIFFRGHLNELSILEVYSKPIENEHENENEKEAKVDVPA